MTTESTTEQTDGAAYATGDAPLNRMPEQLAVVPIEDRTDTQIAIFGTNDPVAIVQRTVDISKAIGQAIEQGGMTTTIQGNKYVMIEGWSLLGTMLRVFPRVIRIDDLEEDGTVVGYEAEVGLFTQDNVQVGSAIAECSRTESRWSNREPNQIKSMAQTRAAGKAFRMTFGYVMKMAGYAATPAEEMPAEEEMMQSSSEPRTGIAPQAAQQPEKPKRSQTVKSLLDWAEETYGFDRKMVYRILGDITNEAGIQDIGLREAAERIRDHHDNPSGDDVSPDEPEAGEFREED